MLSVGRCSILRLKSAHLSGFRRFSDIPLVTYVPQGLPKDTLYIIDGSSILYNAYYSKSVSKASKTLSANNVDCTPLLTMLSIICRFVNRVGPSRLAIAFDNKTATGTCARTALYPLYKSSRKEVCIP